MNRYYKWKYITIFIVILISFLYTLPNWYGFYPVIQISSTRLSYPIDKEILSQIKKTLSKSGLEIDEIFLDKYNKSGITVIIRVQKTDMQSQICNLLHETLNENIYKPDYIVSLNSFHALPKFMRNLGFFKPRPLSLGLDLRGGVLLVFQVYTEKALDSYYNLLIGNIKEYLKNEKIQFTCIEKLGIDLIISFPKFESCNNANTLLHMKLPNTALKKIENTGRSQLVITPNPVTISSVKKDALRKNIEKLRNRINELGITEPIVQQQGSDRIMIQLPGTQDIIRAKDLLGRTAILEIRAIDDSSVVTESDHVPFGFDLYTQRDGKTILVRQHNILTGENLCDAKLGYDPYTRQPLINLTLDEKGSQVFRNFTRNNINKRIAVILFENDLAEVITTPVIRSEIPGGQVQISGFINNKEAVDIAFLLRSGSLTAPMKIVEEKILGPSLGITNIKNGFKSTIYGFIIISIFIIFYYRLFGLFSSVGLIINLFSLCALLSMLQVTLTLPGIAAIALTLGIAIDSNVLINERIREELRNGIRPRRAISNGFDHAWSTILDSNLTMLIIGLGLLIFDSGPIRGFAVVHCLGIATSIFSSVISVYALTNFWYGKYKKITSISI